MLGDDPPRARLGRLAHRDLVIEPRRRDHALAPVLGAAYRAVYHESDAVDEPYRELYAALERHLDAVLGHELRLARHDGAARAALGELVAGPRAGVLVVDARDDERLHETLDERGFPRPDGADDPNVDAPSGTACDVLVYAFHAFSSQCDVRLLSDNMSLAPRLCARERKNAAGAICPRGACESDLIWSSFRRGCAVRRARASGRSSSRGCST